LFEVIDVQSGQVSTLSTGELQNIVQGLHKLASRSYVLPKLLRTIQPLFSISLKGIRIPNVVLFGQPLNTALYEAACTAASKCDCMFVVGTSGTVFPAANLKHIAKQAGARVFEINPTPIVELNSTQTSATIYLTGLAEQILPELVERAMQNKR
jgi:NAD-dependent deacetylase